MGKIHRIKKHFWRLVSQQPLPTGYHRLAGTSAYISIGRRPVTGTYYVWHYSGDRAYQGIIKQLIKEYETHGGDSS